MRWHLHKTTEAIFREDLFDSCPTRYHLGGGVYYIYVQQPTTGGDQDVIYLYILQVIYTQLCLFKILHFYNSWPDRNNSS